MINLSFADLALMSTMLLGQSGRRSFAKNLESKRTKQNSLLMKMMMTAMITTVGSSLVQKLKIILLLPSRNPSAWMP
jgi:hypothetical protein